jgi:hypothetical protein
VAVEGPPGEGAAGGAGGGGEPVQVTEMNARKGKQISVSDYDWDRDGRRIVFQVAVLDGSVSPELWMIDVK